MKRLICSKTYCAILNVAYLSIYLHLNIWRHAFCYSLAITDFLKLSYQNIAKYYQFGKLEHLTEFIWIPTVWKTMLYLGVKFRSFLPASNFLPTLNFEQDEKTYLDNYWGHKKVQSKLLDECPKRIRLLFFFKSIQSDFLPHLFWRIDFWLKKVHFPLKVGNKSNLDKSSEMLMKLFQVKN